MSPVSPVSLMGGVVVAHVVSLMLTAMLIRAPFTVLDYPNERSLHTRAVPRTGGLALMAGFASAILLASPAVLAGGAMGALLGATLALLVLSLADDVEGLRAALRLGVHVAAALALVPAGLVPPALELGGWAWPWPAWLALPVSVLFVVWMTNLYNFMDGMDGLAGSMAVIGFGTYALLGWMAGVEVFACVNAALAAAAAGFLVWNLPPARIFMGDVGSIPLGYLAAGMALWADLNGLFPFWMGILIFSPFIVDATVTLLRRAWRRERVWQAHRMHYYQRLARSGWGHRCTLLWELLLMAGAAGSAVAAFLGGPPVELPILLGWVLLYALLGVRFARVGWDGAGGVS